MSVKTGSILALLRLLRRRRNKEERDWMSEKLGHVQKGKF